MNYKEILKEKLNELNNKVINITMLIAESEVKNKNPTKSEVINNIKKKLFDI